MSDMKPQEAARRLRCLDAFSGMADSDFAVIRAAADMLDPPKQDLEWSTVGNIVVRREGPRYTAIASLQADLGGPCRHRAIVTMHALRADEDGIDVVTLIEEARAMNGR